MDVDYKKFFTDVEESGRWSLRKGHSLTVKPKVEESPYMPEIRRQFFTQRVIEPWNSLPEEMVRSESVEAFKHQYDKWRGLIRV